jgi:hypothetical protein
MLMTVEPRWVVLDSFGSGLEADIARQTLEAEAIPVLVRGNQAGIFGGAFQGPVIGGVELLVPETELARARELVGPGED